MRPGVHGCGVRCTSGQERSVLGDDASPRAEIGPAGSLHEMRNAGRERRPPQGWQPSKQRSAEFDAALSLLSHQGASRASFLRDLWTAAEGARLLQQALHQMEEIWRPPSVQSAGAENVQGLHSTGSCERSLRDALHEGEASGQSASDCGGIGRGERRLRGWAVRRLTPR